MIPDESTGDPHAGLRALEESQAARRDTRGLLAEAREAFNLIKAHRDANHYADKVRAIFRGGLN